MLSKIYKTSFVLILFLKCLQMHAQPVITLLGQDTVRIKIHDNYISAGATAYDGIDGNLTDSIEFRTDLDTGSTGIYTEEYFVKNSKGQKQYKYRIIIVVLNLIPPSIKLIGPDTVYIEAMRNNPPFYDSGGIIIPGNSVNLSILVTTGIVNTKVIGKYNRVYMVQDIVGNKAYAYRTIFVRDTRPPVWNDSSKTKYLQVKHLFNDQVKASDAYDDSLSWNIEYNLTGPVNINKIGSYRYTYSSWDSSGNKSILNVEYIVRDTISPLININGKNPLRLQVNCTNKPYTDLGATAIDEANGDLTKALVTTGNVNTLKIGTYFINYSVADSSANTTTAKRMVIVEDKQAPQIIFPSNSIQILLNEPYTPKLPSVWDDSCESLYLKKYLELVNINVDNSTVGIYSETWRVTDTSGNVSNDYNRIVKVVESLSIRNNKISNEFISVYPNPVSQLLNISLNFNYHILTIKILDINGRILLNTKASDSIESIDLSNFESGIYSIEIEADEKIVREKIIKY
jgi:hypothetical protein